VPLNGKIQIAFCSIQPVRLFSQSGFFQGKSQTMRIALAGFRSKYGIPFSITNLSGKSILLKNYPIFFYFFNKLLLILVFIKMSSYHIDDQYKPLLNNN